MIRWVNQEQANYLIGELGYRAKNWCRELDIDTDTYYRFWAFELTANDWKAAIDLMVEDGISCANLGVKNDY